MLCALLVPEMNQEQWYTTEQSAVQFDMQSQRPKTSEDPQCPESGVNK